MKITAEEFEKHVGHPPMLDDLERVNCEKAGQIHHKCCGWNTSFNKPVFMVGRGAKKEMPDANR
jgi:hypothetical protein